MHLDPYITMRIMDCAATSDTNVLAAAATESTLLVFLGELKYIFFFLSTLFEDRAFTWWALLKIFSNCYSGH